MASELEKCPVCGVGYLLPEDRQEHASRHTAYLRCARIASRYANYHLKEFRSLVEEYVIAEMIGLGESGFPAMSTENEGPLYIHRNVYTSDKRSAPFEGLCANGYATFCFFQNLWTYQLTYKGFEATAAWLRRDLIFPLGGH